MSEHTLQELYARCGALSLALQQAQAVALYVLREWTDPEDREDVLESLRAEGVGVPEWLEEAGVS